MYLIFADKFTSKQSTDKELARQSVEIEALQKKLNRETEEKMILQDEMTRRYAQLQNIKETKLPNSEGIISCFYLVSHSQTQPTTREWSGQPTILVFVKSLARFLAILMSEKLLVIIYSQSKHIHNCTFPVN